MEKAPRVLNIFGKSVPILRLDLEENDGLFDPRNFTISIDKDLDGVELMATELHELIHAVAERTGLTRTSIHPDVWETICENISRAILENYEVKPL